MGDGTLGAGDDQPDEEEWNEHGAEETGGSPAEENAGHKEGKGDKVARRRRRGKEAEDEDASGSGKKKRAPRWTKEV